jgi:O-methyltransferase involved in polyketide biosynthesis
VVLYCRAKESEKPNGKIKDRLSEEMVHRLDYDFSALDDDVRSYAGIAARFLIFDRETTGFVNQHPDGIIVNLGAGLDTRFFRVDNGTIRWFDIDQAEMIDLRRHFMTESERHSFISASIPDFEWVDMLPKDCAILFIAEGLLAYFEESQVRTLFQHIADHFPGAQVLLDSGSPLHRKAKFPGIDPHLTPFKWAVSSIAELEEWDPRIRFDKEWFFRDLMGEGHDLLANLLGMMLRPDSKIGRVAIQRQE